jgi:hypothetical protein
MHGFKTNGWDVLLFYLCYSIIRTVFRKNRSDFFDSFIVPTFILTNEPLFPTNLIVLERTLVLSEILTQWEFLQYNSLIFNFTSLQQLLRSYNNFTSKSHAKRRAQNVNPYLVGPYCTVGYDST